MAKMRWLARERVSWYIVAALMLLLGYVGIVEQTFPQGKASSGWLVPSSPPLRGGPAILVGAMCVVGALWVVIMAQRIGRAGADDRGASLVSQLEDESSKSLVPAQHAPHIEDASRRPRWAVPHTIVRRVRASLASGKRLADEGAIVTVAVRDHRGAVVPDAEVVIEMVLDDKQSFRAVRRTSAYGIGLVHGVPTGSGRVQVTAHAGLGEAQCAVDFKVEEHRDAHVQVILPSTSV
jgi:hypothetical protein